MFALEVEYLMGRAYAGSRENRQAPEFPPGPSRLYSALVAAFHQAGLAQGVREALLWLEQQPPPAIAAGRAAARVESGSARYTPRVPTAFVPHNYPRNQCGREVLPWFRLSTGKISRHFPSVWLAGDRVHFIWNANAPEATRQAFEELLEYVGYLGTSSSKVRIAVSDSPPQPELVPCREDEAGELVVSVPYRGRLAVLEQAHRANRQAPPGRPMYYRKVVDAARPPVQSEFDELFVLRTAGRTALPARHTVHYTSALRDALLKTADGLGLNLSAIHGHSDAPHCAFLALPHTGHPHAESTIKAFSIAFPRDIDAGYRAQLRTAAQQLSVLRCGRYGECTLTASTDRPALRTAEPSTWLGPSRRWTTVTPILLDRFPKDRPNETVADVVSRSCARIGLPTPASVEFGAYSPESGVQPVPEFCIQRKPEDRPRLALHMTLEFSKAVRGPVLLGAGRYFGLGLCKPLGDTEAPL